MNTAARQPLAALGRIGIVAGIHLAAFYFIAAGLGVVPGLKTDPMIGTIIPEPERPDEPLPRIPEPAQQRTEVFIPTPEVPPIDTAEPPVAPPGVIRDDPPEIAEMPVGPQPLLVGVRPDARHPLSQPPYPMSEVRAGNEGVAEIEVYVLPNGRVGDARIAKSTGFPALDQSAVDEARRRWRLLPATRDGQPYAQWHRLRVVFKLQNR